MSELTKQEQLDGIARAKRWGPSAVGEILPLPHRERELVLLAAGLLDMEPGTPDHPRDCIDIDLRGDK